MVETLTVRPAHPQEADALTAIALAAKAHWGYPASAMRTWLPDLVITREAIAAQPVFVAERGGLLLGVALLGADAEPLRELEALWVHPRHMGAGVGTALLRHAAQQAAATGARALSIDADPHAEAFYLSRGALRTGEVAAPIDGQPHRVRPQLRLDLRKD
jgi:GNAT superfamily N-acetyltransferase